MAKKLIEGQMTVFQFFTKENEERLVKVPYTGILLMIKSLRHFKESLEGIEPEDIQHKLTLEHEIKELTEYIDILEGSADFNFNKFSKKLMRRKQKQDDAGMDALQASMILHKN
ncbi:TPA: hypothetical protein ACSQRE_000152 [Clostridium perfringens]